MVPLSSHWKSYVGGRRRERHDREGNHAALSSKNDPGALQREVSNEQRPKVGGKG
jgi:hypothetical protein